MNTWHVRVMLGLVALLLQLAVRAGALGAPTRPMAMLRDEPEPPVLCVHGDVRGKAQVIVAAWENGRVIWSDDPIDGGRPYREVMRTPQEVAAKIAEIASQQFMVATENPCPRRAQFGEPMGTTFHVVINGESQVVNAQQFRLEAQGTAVYTSRGMRLLEGRSIQEVLSNEPPCFLQFRARMEALNAACLDLIPDNPNSYPEKACSFELRTPGETPSGIAPTPSTPPRNRDWAPTTGTLPYTLIGAGRQDAPAVWIATWFGPSGSGLVLATDVLYADGTLIWQDQPDVRTSYRSANVGPGAVSALLSSLKSPPVFASSETSVLRSYNPELRQYLGFVDPANSTRVVVSSHDYIELNFPGSFEGVYGPRTLSRGETVEEWLEEQPPAYRQFRLSWARVKDGLRALRPTDPAQSTALGELTWTLTPISPPTP